MQQTTSNLGRTRTVYLLVLTVNYYTSCNLSRTLPLVWSQEPDNQSIWHLFYGIFTGYRFDNRSLYVQVSSSDVQLSVVVLFPSPRPHSGTHCRWMFSHPLQFTSGLPL